MAPETPPLVYYQSYNGFGLGWKIRVVNEGDEMSISGGTEARGCVVSFVAGVVMAIMGL